MEQRQLPQSGQPPGIAPTDPSPQLSAPAKHFLSPREILAEVSAIAKAKGDLHLLQMVLLGMLAGVYIGFGGWLSTIVSHDMQGHFGSGFARFMSASVFTVGLMLIIVGGAELFTGNCLMVAGVLSGECRLRNMLRNWLVVYLANFAGSVLLALAMNVSGLLKTANWAVGGAALKIGYAKVSLSFSEALVRGILCNWLVCLAVWLSIAARDVAGKILGIYFSIMAFVASGFEHSIANMYFIPAAIMLRDNAGVLAVAGLTDAAQVLTWPTFLTANLLPVTIGNILGGGLFVAAIYFYALGGRAGRTH